MKLRCTHNSIRLRVRKSDLEHLQKEGIVRESVSFSVGLPLIFELAISKVSNVIARFEEGILRIALPEILAQQWISTDQVSIEHHIDLQEDKEVLHILIEKDFPCTNRSEKENADTFKNLIPIFKR